MRLLAHALLAAAAVNLTCEGNAQEFTFEGEAALVSDYRWRGVSLSDEDPSFQVEGTVSHESGAWAWGNVNTVSREYGGAELGLGLGYTRELGSVEWSIGAVHYLYPGEEDIDYTEIDFTAARTFGVVTLSGGIEYVPEQTNYDENDVYTWIGWEIAAPLDLTIHGHVGHDDGIMAPVPYAIDYSLGVSAPIGSFGADLSFVQVESEDAVAVFRISYAFSSS